MTGDQAERADIMRLTSRASGDALAALWRAAGLPDEATDLRRPEAGLVTVRGRVGGDGGPFNLGEATVTRAAVKLPGGEVGHAYILGRDSAKARICALIDAFWQHAATREQVRRAVVAPLRERLEAEDIRTRAQVAATRVDFFTMVRGED